MSTDCRHGLASCQDNHAPASGFRRQAVELARIFREDRSSDLRGVGHVGDQRLGSGPGVLAGRGGSVTQLPIVTMPDDDITHPIPDLTGYITEGQIVLTRELDRRGISPPIDVLPSLSRLMNAGIGPGKTREDHRTLADQLYALLGRARELRRLVAIVGEGSLSAADRRLLALADEFERSFVHQGAARRTIDETLDLIWDLLSSLPPEELTRLDPALLRSRR